MPVKIVKSALTYTRNARQESSGDHRRVDSDRTVAAAIGC